MLAVIRIRGRTGIKPDARKTAKLLRLHRVNHLALVDDNVTTRGMLQTVKDYVTWGEIDKETLRLTLEYRLLFKGHKKVPEGSLKDQVGFSSYKEIADKMMKGGVHLKDLKDAVPVIRLNPPAGGWEYIRKPYGQGGSLGYRGNDINRVIKKMLKEGADLNGKKQD
jgi:large subunit ribosomal protein L30